MDMAPSWSVVHHHGGARGSGAQGASWGMAVTEAEGVPVDTAVVGDFATGAMLFVREDAQIRTGLINDQFVRNMQTVLAELRAAFAVFRPVAFCRVTGV